MRLRDLLKFDFYFADSAAFREHVAEEMSWQHDDWESHVASGDESNALLRAKRPLIAGAMLRPFFEAYEIVADALRDAPAEIDEKDLTKKALGLGNQYVAQNRVHSNEAVSALLFATARQVVADQKLLAPAADLAERRTAFRGRAPRHPARHGQGRAVLSRAVLRARNGAPQHRQQTGVGSAFVESKAESAVITDGAAFRLSPAG